MLINKTNACDQIVERIKQSIISGEFKIGERLPTELQLTEMFGVSRVPVREALRTLRQAGFLVTKHGVGTFVNIVSPDIMGNEFGAFMFLQDKSIIEMLQLRRLLEVESARLAAMNATAMDVKKIKEFEALAREEILKLRAGKDNSFYAADLGFHVAIAEASHNGIYVRFINSIHETLHFHQFLSLRETTDHDEVIQYHQGVCAAIVERNPEKASSMMDGHIKRVEKLISVAVQKAKVGQGKNKQ
ncbi:FadR/GntR family transcriptional regulator [Propionivibrio sp.]|jgi:GntR family transcriptional repressor for pyruvate dehydrogenase complex|uniref:FadR/GntR family transcriptional regulator n=1 Tax=Propionivibrio sp. TaxID=2212460 RepID=UPI0039E56265